MVGWLIFLVSVGVKLCDDLVERTVYLDVDAVDEKDTVVEGRPAMGRLLVFRKHGSPGRDAGDVRRVDADEVFLEDFRPSLVFIPVSLAD